tara:strand:+ start:774 stop:1139 length:366 start_codon:yes stop_codon:yes gene_type:complete
MTRLQDKIKNNNAESNNIKKSESREKKIINFIVIPLAFCFALGILGEGCDHIVADCFSNLDSILMVLGYGFGQFGVIYYPQKLIMLLINGLMNKKWKWPIGYVYFIFPAIVFSYLLFNNFI